MMDFMTDEKIPYTWIFVIGGGQGSTVMRNAHLSVEYLLFNQNFLASRCSSFKL